MTNILASIVVSLVTNVTEVVPQEVTNEETSCPENRPGCAVIHYKTIPSKTKKEIVTATIRREVLIFDWNGRRSATNDVVISETRKRLVKKDEWVEAPKL